MMVRNRLIVLLTLNECNLPPWPRTPQYYFNSLFTFSSYLSPFHLNFIVYTFPATLCCSRPLYKSDTRYSDWKKLHSSSLANCTGNINNSISHLRILSNNTKSAATSIARNFLMPVNTWLLRNRTLIPYYFYIFLILALCKMFHWKVK